MSCLLVGKKATNHGSVGSQPEDGDGGSREALSSQCSRNLEKMFPLRFEESGDESRTSCVVES